MKQAVVAIALCIKLLSHQLAKLRAHVNTIRKNTGLGRCNVKYKWQKDVFKGPRNLCVRTNPSHTHIRPYHN